MLVTEIPAVKTGTMTEMTQRFLTNLASGPNLEMPHSSIFLSKHINVTYIATSQYETKSNKK